MIPVLLMLFYPGPACAGPIPAPAAAQRASDADRDIAADILCAAVGDGRLTLGELDERLGIALSARTITELAALIADLPTSPGTPPPGPGGAGDPAARRYAAPSRWALIQRLIDARAEVRRPAAGEVRE